MYNYEISDRLRKTLRKLYKKDKIRYGAVLKKIESVVKTSDVSHFKNLSGEMKSYKRVHIDRSFVLVFRVKWDTVYFEDLDHHDSIY